MKSPITSSLTVLPQLVWSVLKESLGWEANPVTLNDYFVEIIGNVGRKNNKSKVILLSAVCWVVWLNRRYGIQEKNCLCS